MKTEYKLFDPTGKLMTVSAGKMLVRGFDYHANGVIAAPMNAEHAAQLLHDAGVITLIKE